MGGLKWTREISCKIDTDKSHTLWLHGRQPSPQEVEQEERGKGNVLYKRHNVAFINYHFYSVALLKDSLCKFSTVAKGPHVGNNFLNS